MTTLFFIILILAIAFDYLNGFHDAATTIAIVVSTKVLKPAMAVLWAAAFNFAAYFFFTDHHIANTIAGMIDKQFVHLDMISAGLTAAISWSLFAWRYGIPTSSSHALLGGLFGSGMTDALIQGYNPLSAIDSLSGLKIVSFIVLAPIIALALSIFISILIVNIFKNIKQETAGRTFKILQLISSAALSFAHAGNNAQKMMGIIILALITQGLVIDVTIIPWWVSLVCYSTISAGTIAGGLKVMRTMKTRITKVTPIQGVSAESAGAMALGITEALGIPVSTTQTLTGAIVGVGIVNRVSAVRWGVSLKLLWAWVLTIQINGLLGGLILALFKCFM